MKDISVCGIDCAVMCAECNKHEELQNNPCKGCNAAEGIKRVEVLKNL